MARESSGPGPLTGEFNLVLQPRKEREGNLVSMLPTAAEPPP